MRICSTKFPFALRRNVDWKIVEGAFGAGKWRVLHSFRGDVDLIREIFTFKREKWRISKQSRAKVNDVRFEAKTRFVEYPYLIDKFRKIFSTWISIEEFADELTQTQVFDEVIM